MYFFIRYVLPLYFFKPIIVGFYIALTLGIIEYNNTGIQMNTFYYISTILGGIGTIWFVFSKLHRMFVLPIKDSNVNGKRCPFCGSKMIYERTEQVHELREKTYVASYNTLVEKTHDIIEVINIGCNKCEYIPRYYTKTEYYSISDTIDTHDVVLPKKYRLMLYKHEKRSKFISIMLHSIFIFILIIIGAIFQ